jgi:hypothetical protein
MSIDIILTELALLLSVIGPTSDIAPKSMRENAVPLIKVNLNGFT